jgi:thimet oligopeptidase
MRALASSAALFALLALPAPAPAAPGEPALNWSMSPAAIGSSCSAVLAALTAKVRAIAPTRPGGPERANTFANTVGPLENATADAGDALAVQNFLSAVAPEKAVRDASLACQTDTADTFARLTARPELYAAVASAVASGTARTVYDRKLGQLWLTALRRAGGALPAEKRAELVRLEAQLSGLELAFQRNLADDATTIVLSRREMDGVPDDVAASFARTSDGSYVVPVNASTHDFLQYANSATARKAYYLAYNDRASTQNVALLERAIAVRDRIAHLLGYETWAAYQLDDRMAQSPARVEKFVAGVASALQPAVAAQLAAMQSALDAGRRNAAPLQPWDIARGEYLLRKAHAFDESTVRRYFPVQHTIDAVLDFYHTLLGVNFEAVSPAGAWAPGVIEYRVTDTASGVLLGITYFDLYPRPGKFDYFENDAILPVRAGRVPVSAIIGNWPPSAPGAPALLTHGDVVTFFHEFGHNMAALLATAPYESLSDGFRLDFVEAPSQMLENFAWQPEILRRISANVDTGAPLPDATIAQIVASRSSTDAYEMLRLLTYAAIDMQYHSSGPHVDTTAVWAHTAAAMLPSVYYPGTHPQVSFGHLMSGYDAGLYAYPWSEVYAQDMFTAFAVGNLADPAAGMRYRADILAPARTYEPDDEVNAFLGRPANPDAFFARYGIAPVTSPTPSPEVPPP